MNGLIRASILNSLDGCDTGRRAADVRVPEKVNWDAPRDEVRRRPTG